jgi:hypothetical protein
MPDYGKKLVPSESQVRKFWEWCGFSWKDKEYLGSYRDHERCTDVAQWGNGGWFIDNKLYDDEVLPPIDLNNLFEYAVPKLRHADMVYWNNIAGKKRFRAEVWNDRQYLDGLIGYVGEDDDDPALALFWAIYKVMEAEHD